eukprot:Lithocolla_globosa_v1_NODE_2736_length_1888_cov_18.795417.p1 type:complete len:399 gc:universal NODE_2736_length_1888_cov_18.795417:232-1428(+)
MIIDWPKIRGKSKDKNVFFSIMVLFAYWVASLVIDCLFLVSVFFELGKNFYRKNTKNSAYTTTILMLLFLLSICHLLLNLFDGLDTSSQIAFSIIWWTTMIVAFNTYAFFIYRWVVVITSTSQRRKVDRFLSHFTIFSVVFVTIVLLVLLFSSVFQFADINGQLSFITLGNLLLAPILFFHMFLVIYSGTTLIYKLRSSNKSAARLRRRFAWTVLGLVAVAIVMLFSSFSFIFGASELGRVLNDVGLWLFVTYCLYLVTSKKNEPSDSASVSGTSQPMSNISNLNTGNGIRRSPSSSVDNADQTIAELQPSGSFSGEEGYNVSREHSTSSLVKHLNTEDPSGILASKIGRPNLSLVISPAALSEIVEMSPVSSPSLSKAVKQETPIRQSKEENTTSIL